MTLASIQKRRMRLARQIAEAVSFEVCIPHSRGYHPLEVFLSSSDWVRKTYSLAPVPDAHQPSLLMSDLHELSRREWIYFDPYTGPASTSGELTYCPDPKRWTVGLYDEGLVAVEEHLKPWWKKAYEKQPVTAWQIIVTIVISAGTFGGGYILGKHEQSGLPSATQPQAPTPVTQRAPKAAKAP